LTAGNTTGVDRAADAAQIAGWEAAGATWWQEGWSPQDDAALIRARIHLGPPRP
jgi:hypothetical protein